MEKLAAWFLTEAGKRAVYISACVGTMFTFSLKAVPNTFFVEQYKDLFHYYEHGMQKPLSEELLNRFKKVMDLLQVPEETRDLYKPFQVIGVETFSAGSAYSRFGVIIGIPINYTYKSVDDIDTSNFRINQETIPWGTPEADLFLKSLVYSEKAQLYGIASEIKMSQTPKFQLDCFYATLPCVSYYAVTNYFNKKFNLYARPLTFRLILYALSATLVVGQYFMLKDLTQTYFEQKIDEELKEKNVVFAEGGKELCGKLMARNVALRELMGAPGKRMFTAYGNETSLIRQKHVPLTERRLFFEKALEEKSA